MVKRNKLMFALSCFLMSLIALIGVYFVLAAVGCIGYRTNHIKIISTSSEKTYDGTELVSNDYKMVGELGFGATLDIDFTGSQLNAGTSDNTFQVKVRDANGIDISSDYEIETVFGKLKVNPITIGIEAKSAEKLYDGVALEANEYTVTQGAPIEGDRIEAVVIGSITDIGVIENKVTARVVNEVGEDVSSNYNLVLTNGKLTVLASRLSVQTQTISKYYDGTPLVTDPKTDWQITSGQLLKGHYTEVYMNAKITNVGEVSNTLVFYIKDENGNDVTNLYEINYSYGKLIVEASPLVIQCGSDKKIYDATPFSVEDYTIISGNLAENNQVVVTNAPRGINVDEYINDLQFRVVDSYGNDISRNYQIKVLPGMFEILPRIIKIKTNDATKIYDGYALTVDDYELLENSMTLIDGHQLVYINDVFVDVGKYENIFKSIKIYDGQTDVSSNYEFYFESGLISILPRDIELTILKGEKVFDYKPFYYTDYQITGGMTLEGILSKTFFKVDEEKSDKIIKAGYYNASDYFLFKAYLGDQDITSNFNIILKDVETNNVYISPYQLTIKTPSVTKVFDNKPFNISEVEIVSGREFIRDIGANVTMNPHENIIYAGTYFNSLTTLNININGVDYSKSFEVSEIVEMGTLTITPYEFTVITPNITHEFDTENHYTVNVDELVLPEFITSNENRFNLFVFKVDSAGNKEDTTSFIKFDNTMVGTHTNRISLVIRDTNFNDISSSFYINYVYGSVTITKANILVTQTKDINSIYTGTSELMPKEDFKITDKDGYEIIWLNTLEYQIISTNTNLNVGKRLNKVELTDVYINFGGYKIPTDYILNISYNYGYIEIIPRKLIVSQLEDYVTYFDGNVKKVPNRLYEVKDGSSSNNTWLNEYLKNNTIIFNQRNDILNAYNYINNFNITISNGENDLTANFEISYNYRNIIVMPRTINVSQVSEIAKTYDGTMVKTTINDLTILPLIQPDDIVSKDEIMDILTNYYNYEIIQIATLVNFGSMDNKFRIDLSVKDETSIYSNSNFLMKYDFKEIRIYKRILNVYQKSDLELIYNGEAQGLTNSMFNDYVGILCKTEFLNYLNNNVTFKIINALKKIDVINTENSFELSIYDSTGEITDNFILKYEYLKLIIKPIEVSVEVLQKTDIEYDGQSHQFKLSDVIVDSSNIIKKDLNRFSLNLISSQSAITPGIHNLRVRVEPQIDSIYTENYIIKETSGTFTIKPRFILITSMGKQAYFDPNKELYNKDFYIAKETPLISGHEIKVVEFTRLSTIGSVRNILTFIITENGKNVSDYYEIMQISQELVYLKNKTSYFIAPERYIVDYSSLGDSKVAYANGANIELVGLDLEEFEGCTYKVIYSGQATLGNSGIIKIEEFHLYNKLGEEITYDYDFIFGENIIQVVNFDATVTTLNHTKEYDGTPLSGSITDVIVSPLTEGYFYEVSEIAGSITMPGITANTVKIDIYYLNDNNEKVYVTNQFRITYNYGTLKVDRRNFTIIVTTNGDILTDGLLDSHKDLIEFIYSDDAGTITVQGFYFTDTNISKLYVTNPKYVYE